MNAAFDEPRRQDPGAEVRTDGKRFQARSQARTRDASIKTRYQPDLQILQRGNHVPQVVGLDADVAVVYHDVFVPRFRQHLRQVADFDVHAQVFQTEHKPDRNLRKFSLQSLDECNRRIISLADAKDNFVLGIVLQKMTAKAVIHLRISTPERLENRNRRYVWCRAGALARRLSLAQESSCAEQAKNV